MIVGSAVLSVTASYLLEYLLRVPENIKTVHVSINFTFHLIMLWIQVNCIS